MSDFENLYHEAVGDDQFEFLQIHSLPQNESSGQSIHELDFNVLRAETVDHHIPTVSVGALAPTIVAKRYEM